MKTLSSLNLRVVLLSSVILSFSAFQPADASVIFATGNVQYNNVNLAAAADAMTITGDIGNTGITMTFNTMIGPDRSTQVEMHGQQGVAFVESFHDSAPAVTHTGFSSITLSPQAGYGFTAGDFALDELNGTTGSVTLLGKDQFGNSYSDVFALGNGQNQFNFTTAGGEYVTGLIFTTDSTALLADIKQVSFDAGRIPVPEPAALVLFGVGLAGLGLLRRRK